MARRMTTNHEIAGSNPVQIKSFLGKLTLFFFFFFFHVKNYDSADVLVAMRNLIPHSFHIHSAGRVFT